MRGLNTKLVLAGAVALVAGLFVTSAANADWTLPQNATSSIPLTLADFTSPPTGVLSFQKFNMPGTTLLSVKLTLTGTMDTTLTFDAAAGGGNRKVTRVTTLLSMWAQDSGNNLLSGGVTASQEDPQFFMPVEYYSLGTVAPGTSKTTGLLTSGPTTLAPVQYTSAPILAEFKGPGNLTLNVATFTQHGGIWSGGEGTVNGIDHASITGTVAYEYASVPEATTMLLGGMAVMPILMQRRRQRGAAAQA